MKREVNRRPSLAAVNEAIAAIESQREVLGESETNIALFALRQKMAALKAEATGASEPGRTTLASNGSAYTELVVLAADLSGFTALAERMDAERVRDAINAMWQALDAVVESWGGHIDQHAGDGIVALFGLPRPRRSDLLRALHTALALQEELAAFNKAAQQQRGGWTAGWPGPTMRIGVHCGPVFFGKAGRDSRRTAVGDTVNLAKALEQAAPAGGVLVSTAVAQQGQPLFEFASQEVGDTSNGSYVAGKTTGDETIAKTDTENPGKPPPDLALQAHNGQTDDPGVPLIRAYQVVGENRNNLLRAPGLIAGQETRFTGRERELDFLEQALRSAADSRFPQLVTITAEPGVGASRLLYEFERRTKLLPGRFAVLRSGAIPLACQTTLALWRDLVSGYGGIHFQDSPGVMREKVARVISGGYQHSGEQTPDEDSYHLAEILLTAWTEGNGAVSAEPAIIEALVSFLQAAGGDETAILVLEHLHQADDASLAVLEAIVEGQADLPLLVVCTSPPPQRATITTTQPGFLRRQQAWQKAALAPFSPYHHLDLRPLSAIDGRHMLTEALQRLHAPPLRLVDLIAAQARGNPLFIEELVKLLLDKRVIVADPGSGRWRVDMAEMEATRLPTTLKELFRARLAQLPPQEQQLLDVAAVMGPVFWDVPLWQDIGEWQADEVGDVDGVGDVEAALLSLEQGRLISPNQRWSFAGAQAYTFAHSRLGDAAYSRLSQARRSAIHRQVVQWLVAHRRGSRAENYFPPATLITYHLERAGEPTQATTD